ncbi:MAG: hypothetical protein AABZ80_13475 [Gemmatimonadota bacterium]
MPTPNIDSLAAQGIRLDNFNVVLLRARRMQSAALPIAVNTASNRAIVIAK